MLTALLLLGCRPSGDPQDSGPPQPVPLVDAALWQPADAAADPLADHRPDEVSCAPQSWYVEYEGLEVDTTSCNYLSLSQPLLIPLSAGEPLEILAWHQSLLASEPAQAHLAVLIDGAVAWELTVDIPADPSVYEAEVAAPAEAAAGAPVVVHLHNHGGNTWQLNELSALR